jgi:hypothetical protein
VAKPLKVLRTRVLSQTLRPPFVLGSCTGITGHGRLACSENAATTASVRTYREVWLVVVHSSGILKECRTRHVECKIRR